MNKVIVIENSSSKVYAVMQKDNTNTKYFVYETDFTSIRFTHLSDAIQAFFS